MAYMHKDLKNELAAAVKAVLPKGWKATFAIRNYSTIVCTIRSAPLDLKATFETEEDYFRMSPYRRSEEFHKNSQCKDAEVYAITGKILEALNGKNFDESDAMTDYFHVGYYVELNFGTWDKPFVNK